MWIFNSLLVLKTTGFFEGLFDEEELISENVKDRENKIAFLSKVITVVGWTTGKSLSVKPSKIVAGQEPEKTNELLQCLAYALDKNLSSHDAVQKYREGKKPTKTNEKKLKDSTKSVTKSNEPNKLTSKSNEKLEGYKKESSSHSSSKNDNDKTNIKIKQKERNSQKNESPPKKLSQQSKPTISKKTSLEKQQSERNDNNIGPKPTKPDVTDKDTEISEITQNENKLKLDNKTHIADSNTDLITNIENNLDRYEDQNLNSSYTIIDTGLNSSLSSQDLMATENTKTKETLREDLNARHDSTVITEQHNYSEQIILSTKHVNYEEVKKESLGDRNNIDNIDEVTKPNIDINVKEKPDGYSLTTKSPSKIKNARPLSVRPSSSRPGAPRPRDKLDTILVETENIMVGKVNIITENAPNEEDEDTSIIIVEHDAKVPEVAQDEQEQIQASLNEHGHLVQQILDSQKEYSQMTGKTEIEWQFGAKKARDALNKEIEQLRFDIQALSRVANPLGKLLDHIQEDVEVMRQELHQWTKTFEESSKELAIQKTANDESLFPLYAKVKQLNTDILEKHDKISDLKIIIHKNSNRIEKLLENGNVLT